MQPLGMMVFCVAAFAEASRLPFDLPEAEQELIGGYHTEYFGIKLMMYLVGEYLHMVAAAFLIVILFFGGWHFWGLTGSARRRDLDEAVLRIVVLNVKVLGMIFFFMVARWSWARFRLRSVDVAGMAGDVAAGHGQRRGYVAVWDEYGRRLAEPRGFSPQGWCTVGCGWAVLLVAWLAATMSTATAGDNRPRARTDSAQLRERGRFPAMKTVST